MSKGHSVCIQTCMSISMLTGQTKVWGFWKDHWKGLREENPNTFKKKKTHTNSFNLHRFSAKCSFSILSQLMLLKIHGVVVFPSVKDSVLMCATIVLLKYNGTSKRWGKPAGFRSLRDWVSLQPLIGCFLTWCSFAQPGPPSITGPFNTGPKPTWPTYHGLKLLKPLFFLRQCFHLLHQHSYPLPSWFCDP